MRASIDMNPPNSRASALETTTVIMPIGGLATRARELTGDLIPKHLILLGNGKPILHHVLRGLQGAGFRDFVFCVGQHKEQIANFIHNEEWNSTGANYRLSEEEELLGPDGAVQQAIEVLGIEGRAMVVPGDAMLPWGGLAEMTDFHAQNGDGITAGVTSYITERTTDVGRLVVEDDTNRLLWCYPREAQDLKGDQVGSRGLTSAAAMVINIAEYMTILDVYKSESAEPGTEKIGFRDDIAPWLIQNGEYQVRAFDVRGEVLDLGTPKNIAYGIEHWQDYA